MFSNLTDEQVETIEKMIQDAYVEGWHDADDHGNRRELAYRQEDWEMSLAKNESCHVVAGKFMKSVGLGALD